jgi:DNA-binding transcriptional LysR family regulator
VLDWDDLKVFLAIARQRTLSGAARQLAVDQTTVGRRLQALETSVGARLFDRTSAGFALTGAGETIRASVEQIEATTWSVERSLQGRDASLEGRVRLGTSDSFAAWFLVERLSGLRQRHPGIAIELLTGNRALDLARLEADVSLRLVKPAEPHLIARRIGRAGWALYGAESYVAKHPRRLARALEGHDVVAPDDELRGTVGARWLAANASRARVVLTCNGLLSQAAAVVAGLGLGPLPCLYGDRQPTLRRLSPRPIGFHDIWLVVHPDVRGSARVRAVMDHLTSVIEKEAALLAGTKRA